jgi:predicted RNA-binding protein with PUA-like domain
MARRYWLLKSEPSTYSIDDLKRDGRTGWGGVRNYQARNFMRDDMQPGDLALFYHSSSEPPGAAGVATIDGPAEPDPTQFDKKSPYFDAASPKEAPRWLQVPVRFTERFAALVPLEVLRADPKLEGMALFQRGQRLSIQPVSKAHFARVLKLAKAKTAP